ncbi:MAG: Holliday junction branch migration protein RuvA [Bifidobacteriaceae bacterium]|nr:Holliday junction branch migration protein RuvA [Bifidobacteriaceae bacterium]
MMLSFLEGQIISISDFLVLECFGIGFEIAMPERDMEKLEVGEKKRIEVSLRISPEGPRLYGFLNAAEKQIFSVLLKVPGIGPKAALSILSNMGMASLAKAVKNKDSSPLLKVPGIGPKAASRLISSLQEADLGFVGEEGAESDGVVEALESLGWKSFQAQSAYRSAKEELPLADSSALLKACLQILDRHA